jgi:WD40 repeat protein
VALSADGRRAVSASSDNTLKIWDVDSGMEVRTLAGHSSFVNGVALSADGRLAVSASADKTLKVWDVGTGRELSTLAGHKAAVNGVALSADGRRAVSASSDNTLKVWDLDMRNVLAPFTCDAAVRCASFSGFDAIIAGDDLGRIHFLELVV